MSTVTMSLYKALEKKKIYEDRLKTSSFRGMSFFGYYSEGNKTVNGLDLETAGKKMKSEFDTENHLRSNILALKVAINEANVQNTIVVEGYKNNQPITLVEAITTYQDLDARVRYLKSIADQLQHVQKVIRDTNASKLDPDNVAVQVSKMGTNDKKGESTAETFAALMDEFREKNMVKLFDPCEIVKNNWLQKQVEEINNFKANVHTAIMEKNVAVQITVELED